MSSRESAVSRRAVLAAGAAFGAFSCVDAAAAGPRRSASPPRPHVVFILADDLGYADVGCYGARSIRTPHVDRLAAEGAQFLHGYANSPVCSATRTALITGRYQYRLDCGLEEPIGGPRRVGLPPSVPTMPSGFRSLGYRTVLLGKWHLGAAPNFGPLKSGYDRFFGVYPGGVDYFSHALRAGEGRPSILFEGETPIDREGYLTDLLADEAVSEIEGAAGSGRPLFLSLHFTAPHWPWEGPDDAATTRNLTSLAHTDGGNLATYTKMVESMDRNIGKVLAALDRHGMSDDTIVVFTSDNGGERFSDVWPLVGMKGELLEGGIRVPLVVRWPRHVPGGSRSDQTMISMDFLPTLLAAAGGAPQAAAPPDGENLLDVLTGQAPAHERTLFWRYKANEQAAVRRGDWKYLKINGKEYLFNLAEDQRERANLKDKHKDKLGELQAAYAKWNATMLPYPEASLSHTVREFAVDR